MHWQAMETSSSYHIFIQSKNHSPSRNHPSSMTHLSCPLAMFGASFEKPSIFIDVAFPILSWVGRESPISSTDHALASIETSPSSHVSSNQKSIPSATFPNSSILPKSSIIHHPLVMPIGHVRSKFWEIHSFSLTSLFQYYLRYLGRESPISSTVHPSSGYKCTWEKSTLFIQLIQIFIFIFKKQTKMCGLV